MTARPTRCPRCRSPFPSRAQMLDHVKRCRAWLDDEGEPYDWMFSCSVCGSVYVRDGNGHHPRFEILDRTMLEHLSTHDGEPHPKATVTL